MTMAIKDMKEFERFDKGNKELYSGRRRRLLIDTRPESVIYFL